VPLSSLYYLDVYDISTNIGNIHVLVSDLKQEVLLCFKDAFDGDGPDPVGDRLQGSCLL